MDVHRGSWTPTSSRILLARSTRRPAAWPPTRPSRPSAAHSMTLLVWARGLDAERVWAIEDCRHVSGALERFLLEHGEQVVRVAPRLVAGARSSARERGKSDLVNAASIARAVLREGLDTLPLARLAGAELDVRLRVDHHERLRHAGHAADQRPARAPARPLARARDPARVLITNRWQERIGMRVARSKQTARVRIARDELLGSATSYVLL